MQVPRYNKQVRMSIPALTKVDRETLSTIAKTKEMPNFYELCTKTPDKHGTKVRPQMNCIIAYEIKGMKNSTQTTMILDMKNRFPGSEGLVTLESTLKNMDRSERAKLLAGKTGYSYNGSVRPDLRVKIDEATFADLQKGKMNGLQAMLMGKI